ncbi:MAG: hypothetical protein WBD40_05565 [Tepidisphaeraceae bacterium]
MATGAPAKLSPIKWFVGVLVFFVFTLSCAALGIWLSGGPRDGVAPAALPAMAIGLIALGIVSAALGAAIYGLILLTSVFTFDFTRPYFRTFGGKLWVANLVVGMLIAAGFAFVMAPTLLAILGPLMPGGIVAIVAVMLPFFIAQLFFVWLTIWAPLETGIIAKRLGAKGIGPDLLSRGHYIGISDPTKSSLKKMTLVEEDMGMLWLEPDALMYRGDAVDFDVVRDQLLAIERQADAGSTSSYFGAVHVILRIAAPGQPGGERRVRLHPEGDWTLTGKARALNDLADRLASWKATTTLSRAAPFDSTVTSTEISP